MDAFAIKLKTIILVICYLNRCVYCDTRAFGRKLSEYVIRTEYGISFNECIHHCDNVVDCLSVNYFRQTHFCELNSESMTNGFNLDDAKGYVYKEKDSSNDVCTRNKCQTGDVCGVNNTCNITQCSYTLDVKNGEVYGNMFNVGAQRVIECLPDYKLVLGDNITVCTDSGVWGNTSDIRCEKVCPQPNQVDGGIIANSNIITVSGPRTFTNAELTNGLDLDILESSTVTYQCDSDRRMSYSATITCLSGNWSPYPLCEFTYARWCSVDHACSEPGLVCSDFTCICVERRSYSYTERKCVERCSHGLASSFQKSSGLTVFLGDAETWSVPVNECRSKCLSQADCKGFNSGDIFFLGHVCSLLFNYAVDSTFVPLSNHDYYQRDCA